MKANHHDLCAWGQLSGQGVDQLACALGLGDIRADKRKLCLLRSCQCR